MYTLLGLAIVCLVTWGVLVFALAIPSGLIHVPLAAGCILAAASIVRTRRRD